MKRVTTGLDDHPNPNREKTKEGIEGGEDKHCNFEWASYMAPIAPPMPPRDQQRNGED